MNQQIEFNTNRYFAAIVLSLLLIAGGLLLFLKPEVIRSLPLSVGRIQQLGLAICVIFGALFIFVLIKLGGNKVAFEISEDGIEDFAGGIKVGLIKWTDIKQFSIHKHMGIPFIVVHLKDDQVILSKTNKLKQRLIKENQKTFGSPVAISCTMFKMKFEQFKFLMEQAAEKKGIGFKQ